MSLVDEGKLALRDPIVRWLPEFADLRVLDDPSGPLDRTHPVQRAILVEDLLTHTSGLGYGFSVGGPISRAYIRLPFGQGPDAWLAALAELPLVHQPGERLTYGHSTDVVGVLASRIEGKPFHQVLDERILQPLGMIDTGFHVTLEGRRRAATMYRLDDNDTLQHDVMGQPHITPPAFCNAGGGLWSTADDYLRFIEMLLRDGTVNGVRVLSAGIGTADAHRSAHRRAEAAQLSRVRRSGSGAVSGSTCRWSPIRRSRRRCSGRVVSGHSVGPARTGPGGRPIRPPT